MSVGSTNTTSEEVNTASVENKTTETASAEETAAEVSADAASNEEATTNAKDETNIFLVEKPPAEATVESLKVDEADNHVKSTQDKLVAEDSSEKKRDAIEADEVDENPKQKQKIEEVEPVNRVESTVLERETTPEVVHQ